ncbi:protein PIH1D3 [Esox lucius]|uniref:PIH1D1/2/3 CS-like domain-containing protein n=1 Tax=Esox lucius TaxID=8010 RepID=A0A3P8ZY88_ESOLU|nr:protein PIH1D3 [Esox lucius]
MEGLSSFHNLQALSALLSTQGDDDEDDCKNMKSSALMSPGDIHAPPSVANKTGTTAYAKADSKAIWCEEEVIEGSQFDDLTDTRPQPEYDIVLKQSVGTEDIFLGMSGKDPSSMCCDSMLVKIKMPGTKASDVVLDVKDKFLDLRTPNYKLGLHLPHPVHSQEGKAHFYSERQELEVTLPMNRLMDQINLQ